MTGAEEEVKCRHCGARIEPDIDSGLYECGCVAMDALALVGPRRRKGLLNHYDLEVTDKGHTVMQAYSDGDKRL